MKVRHMLLSLSIGDMYLIETRGCRI